MLRGEILPSLKAATWLGLLGVAYALAAFLMPGQTQASAGPVGWGKELVPLFNWKLFFGFTTIALLAVPLLSVLGKKWVQAGTELVLLSITAIASWNLGPQLESSVELTGIEGWKGTVTDFLGMGKSMRQVFDTGAFLLLYAAAFGIWVTALQFLRMARNQSFASADELLNLLLILVAVAAWICFVVGLHLPVFHSTRFWILEQDMTLAGSVYVFFKSGEVFIGVLILLFTFVFPLVKFSALFWALSGGDSQAGRKVNSALAWLGKWSMLDVFVVALLLLNMKLDSGLLDMQLKQGLVFFATSILLTMIASAVLSLRQKKKVE